MQYVEKWILNAIVEKMFFVALVFLSFISFGNDFFSQKITEFPWFLYHRRWKKSAITWIWHLYLDLYFQCARVETNENWKKRQRERRKNGFGIICIKDYDTPHFKWDFSTPWSKYDYEVRRYNMHPMFKIEFCNFLPYCTFSSFNGITDGILYLFFCCLVFVLQSNSTFCLIYYQE